MAVGLLQGRFRVRFFKRQQKSFACGLHGINHDSID